MEIWKKKKSTGKEITEGDYFEIGSDILVAGVGGKLVKATAYSITKSAGVDAAEHIIIDVASEVGAEVIYGTSKENLIEGGS